MNAIKPAIEVVTINEIVEKSIFERVCCMIWTSMVADF